MATNVPIRMRTDATPDKLLLEIVKSPLIYMRCVGMVFSIIVFGCMADKGFSDGFCVLNKGSSACSFGIAIGVLAFIICIVYLVKDVLMVVIDFSENNLGKKVLIIADIGANGFWAFLWFVAFCFIANQHAQTTTTAIPPASVSCMGSTIAFSLFSVILWIAIVVFNVILLIRVLRANDTSGYGNFNENEEENQDEDEPHEQKYSAPEY